MGFHDCAEFVKDFDLQDGDNFSATVSLKSRNLKTGKDYNYQPVRPMTGDLAENAENSKTLKPGNESVVTFHKTDLTSYSFDISPKNDCVFPKGLPKLSQENNVFIYTKCPEATFIITGCKDETVYAYIISNIQKNKNSHFTTCD